MPELETGPEETLRTVFVWTEALDGRIRILQSVWCLPGVQATLAHVAPYPGRFTVHRGFSTAVATEFTDSSLDFVYLDAQHNYMDVTNDLLVWWPKVRATPPPIAPTPTQCAMCIMVPSPLHVQGDSPLFLTTLCRPGLGPCVQLKHGGLYCGDDFFSGYVSDGRSNFGMR